MVLAFKATPSGCSENIGKLEFAHEGGIRSHEWMTDIDFSVTLPTTVSADVTKGSTITLTRIGAPLPQQPDFVPNVLMFEHGDLNDALRGKNIGCQVAMLGKVIRVQIRLTGADAVRRGRDLGDTLRKFYDDRQLEVSVMIPDPA